MAHSDLFLSNKLNALHPAFTNNFLLKHGNIFVKPEIPVNGFPYSFFPSDLGFSPNSALKPYPNVVQNNDVPLDFAIKHEKPPTPPASTSPVNSRTPPPVDVKVLADHSKNATWIAGKQKLSWDNSTVASYNPETKMFRCVVCNAVGFLSRIAEHYLGTHTSAKVFQCLHCPYSSTWSRCVRSHMAKHHGVPNAPPSLWKGQPLLEEIFQLLTNLKTTVDSQGRDRVDPEVCDKKFVCPKCPYTTDRRDLYLRHENIHKEDKPYHCYICFKLFNRADHVKKHFLRIHRGHPYDISLVRRRPPKNSSNNNNNASNGVPKDKIVETSSLNDNGLLKNGTLKDNNGIKPLNLEGFKQAKGFECPFCAWEGADAWCLRRHMSTHMKSYGCPICDFKSSKAERLFTHVYKIHRMLVCTKCKFVTDQAQIFEVHIKDCCVEIVFGPQQLKLNQDDSANDSDTSNSSGMRRQIEALAALVETKPFTNGSDIHSSKMTRFPMNSDVTKGSLSIFPLHNSVSYCFPVQPMSQICAQVKGIPSTLGLNLTTSSMIGKSKVEVKHELASPVQSSSDSGLADLTPDQTDMDLSCCECGCEFADESSLNIHAELYHSSRPSPSSMSIESTRQKKKFSCALCNFSSNEQNTILDHMRFHTGESLMCRAGNTCAFTTIFDSALREHVLKEHSDGKPRCPHCGMHCHERISFIRHYRKCHHSTSCYRCRKLKHELSSSSSGSADSTIQPYLHHNPYSKIGGGYTVRGSPTGNSTPNLQEDSAALSMFENHKERRSRKQSTPRKLVHSQTGVTKRSQRGINKFKVTSEILHKKYISKERARKESFWFCRKCYKTTLCYKNKINYVLHNMWFHNSEKFKCKICSEEFDYRYKVLLHKRRYHEEN